MEVVNLHQSNPGGVSRALHDRGVGARRKIQQQSCLRVLVWRKTGKLAGDDKDPED